MSIEKNKVVALSYELEVEGQIADKAGSEKPLQYIQGTGMLLPKFEEAVEGKDVGDGFEFTLSPEDGYGSYDSSLVIELPKAAFEQDGKLREDLLIIGNIIPMLGADGSVVRGSVKAVNAETVAMDFNHPMAGKTLHFTGKVEAVREASEKELKEGLFGEYLPKEGCHCGKDCEGGCEGSCEGGCESGCHCEGGCES